VQRADDKLAPTTTTHRAVDYSRGGLLVVDEGEWVLIAPGQTGEYLYITDWSGNEMGRPVKVGDVFLRRTRHGRWTVTPAEITTLLMLSHHMSTPEAWYNACARFCASKEPSGTRDEVLRKTET
jgi:hypothetical protein